METFIFKFGQNEFICKAGDSWTAMVQANTFVDREFPLDAEFNWLPDLEGQNIFRMTVGV